MKEVFSETHHGRGEGGIREGDVSDKGKLHGVTAPSPPGLPFLPPFANCGLRPSAPTGPDASRRSGGKSVGR